jgi:hypothetical protein
MRNTTNAPAVTEVTMITDPIKDDESRRVVQRLGCRRFEGSPTRDGTPLGSRSVFALTHSELAAGGLEARIELLAAHGIAVHRVLGEHSAVRRANQQLGYL